ncbi:sensor histidine kinase [Desnuesiella massiliensis]|uniref:sensor histidine kinase n=1 Tax=Desnuesiella massiliensis TaxID=1650662 RepID=UPI0006E12FED|nr:Spo0B domain-containing protein [Desnuesiella massiliensis]
MKSNKNLHIQKVIITSIIINVVQLLIILWISFYGVLKIGNINANGLLYIIILTIIVNSFIIIKNMYLMIFSKGEKQGLIESLQHLTELNKTLRSQRHDFVNHLQVIYNLLELEEYDEGKSYIEKIYKDVVKVNRAMKTSNAAVNALLQAKTIYAEQNFIEVNLYVYTDLKHMPIPAWEFCRVLGNIIDNAIFALNTSNKKEKVLTIELFEDIKSYKFNIINNGPKIESGIIDKIFTPGFSTKGDKGEGVGLSIVKEILNSYGGSIEVKSTDMETSFEGAIYKAKEE